MEITESRRDQLVAYFAGKIKAARLEVPVTLFLETVKPLSFLASQVVLFVTPMFAPFLGLKRMDDFAAFLWDKNNLDRVIRQVEEKPERKGR